MKLMNKESENIDLTAKQRTRLLSLGLSSEVFEGSTDLEEKKADLLYDILTRTLPVDGYIIDSLPPVLRGVSDKLHSVAGELLGDLLQNPKTDISVIEKIKDYAKESGTYNKSKAETDAFLAIYYAAIASALLFHNKRITQHSYKDLKQFFFSFTKKSWVLEELKILFKRAEEYCQKTEKV
jgi:hypothetical protein